MARKGAKTKLDKTIWGAWWEKCRILHRARRGLRRPFGGGSRRCSPFQPRQSCLTLPNALRRSSKGGWE